MIYLHIGVHKTATTYLQTLLADNQGKIAAAGRAYWQLAQVRPLLHELQSRWLWTEDGVRHLTNHPSSPLLRLRELLAVAPDCIISDENMIGFSTQAVDGAFYPYAAKQLRRVRTALGDGPVEVWLSLRSYDGFLASSYCEALRSGYFAPPEAFVARNAALPDERWPALVDAVHACFGEARVVIWDYAEFRPLLPTIAERLAGLPYEALHPLTKEARPSPSAQAIAMHCAAAADLTAPARVLSMARCEDACPRSAYPEPFYPWAQETAEAMKATYREDLTEIASRSYVELLSAARPGSPPRFAQHNLG